MAPTQVKEKDTGFDDLPEGFEIQESKTESDSLPEGFEIIDSSDEIVAPKEDPELSFSEKIGDFMSGGIVSEGKKIQEQGLRGELGERTKVLAENLESVQDSAKLTGDIGQSFILANQTAKLLSNVPALANQRIVQGLVSTVEQRAKASGVRFSNVQRAIQRNLIEGAVAVQPFDYKSIKERIAGTVAGAGLGVVIAGSIGGISKGASTLGRDIKKLSRTIRDPRIPSPKAVKNEISAITKEVSDINAGVSKQIASESKVGAEKTSETLSKSKALRESAKESGVIEKAKQSKVYSQTKREINKNIEILEESLKTESDVAAKSYQNKITGFFRKNSDAYGRDLDVISDEIAKTGRMTRGEASDVLENTIRRSGSEAEVAEGPIISRMKDLIQKKYGIEVTDEATGAMVSRNPDELIDFKDFLKDARDTWKSARPKGGGRYTQDEIPGAILQSEFGELVSRLPGGEAFKSLQADYRSVISYMNRANSILKPYKGEAYRDAAFNLVKRVAKGGSPVESDIVAFIENGTERFAKGIGSYSARSKQIASNIKILKNELKDQGVTNSNRIMEIAEETANKISKIDETAENAVNLIQKEVQVSQARIQQEAARLEMNYQARISQLSGRSTELDKINIGRRNLSRLVNSTVKVIGGLGASYLAVRGISEISTRLTE